MDSNKNKNVRTVTDASRKHLLGLPTTPKRVSREVKPGQKRSYKMSVHQNPFDEEFNEEKFMDRDNEPGEFERTSINEDGQNLIDYNLAHGKAVDIFSGGRSIQMGHLAPLVGAATFATLAKRGKTDQAMELLQSPEFSNNYLGRVTPGTWRSIIKESPIELVDMIARQKFSKDLFLSEVSVLSNTLLRRGVNSIQYIFPEIPNILRGVNHVDLPNRQLFNLAGNVVPSAVEPLGKQGAKILDAGGSKWFFTKEGPSKWIQNFLTVFEGASVRIALQGFPSKVDSRSNIFEVSPRGLSNSYIQIAAQDISKVLGGFLMDIRKFPEGELNDADLDRLPRDSFVIPPIGVRLSRIESNVRERLVKYSNLVNSRELAKEVSLSGSGGVGISELDVYTDKVYQWKGERKGSRPYGPATEDSLFNTSFPHPLIKYRALDYLGLMEDSISRLIPLSVMSLPLKVEERVFK